MMLWHLEEKWYWQLLAVLVSGKNVNIVAPRVTGRFEGRSWYGRHHPELLVVRVSVLVLEERRDQGGLEKLIDGKVSFIDMNPCTKSDWKWRKPLKLVLQPMWWEIITCPIQQVWIFSIYHRFPGWLHCSWSSSPASPACGRPAQSQSSKLEIRRWDEVSYQMVPNAIIALAIICISTSMS